MSLHSGDQAGDRSRIDTLLALAIAFSNVPAESNGVSGDEAEGEVETETASPELSPLAPLSDLGQENRRAIEQRLDWLQARPKTEQSAWVSATLSRVLAIANSESARLDENVHPSQVIRALRAEPPRVRALVARNLPGELANSAAAEGVCFAGDGGDQPDRPIKELVSVVRRAFLSNFSRADDFAFVSSIDSLSPVELARLVRLIGVHETAIACRSIAQVETVASFLSRFAAEDSRAIAMSMLAIDGLKSERAVFAERIVQSALAEAVDPAPALDRIGLSLLGIALEGWDMPRRRYTEQKLPIDAARNLTQLTADADLMPDEATARTIGREIESLAESVQLRSSSARAGSDSKRVAGDANGVS